MDFTVEVTTRPVIGSDWSLHRSVLDAVPGSVLVEDPGAPVLFIPVEAEEAMGAAKFVEGLAMLTGLKIERGTINPSLDDAELDGLFEDDEAQAERTEVVQTLEEYAAQKPQFEGRMASGGRMIAC